MSLEKAYKETIEDFKIELYNTPFWKFKKVEYLHKEIIYYQTLLYNLKK